MTDQNNEFFFGDFEPEDAYCVGDPKPEDIDWVEVQRLQDLIDALPNGPQQRKAAARALQAKLSGNA
jgi:hypothetical protein